MSARRIRWNVVAHAGLATWFVVVSIGRLQAWLQEPAVDGRLYRMAAEAWLQGRDPWAVHLNGLYFAAPPPSLIPMLPFAVLPEVPSVALLVAVGIAATVWSIRRLQLPWYYVAFPPLTEAMLIGNPQTLVLPALLVGAGPLAVFAKTYAGVPLLFLAQWRALAITLALVIVTVPLLPWERYLASDLEGYFRQTLGGTWAVPILVPLVVAALVLMGRKRAAWWAVPAVWPGAQWYYATLCVPALTPLAAVVVAYPSPISPALGAIVVGIERWVAGLSSSDDKDVERGTPSPEPRDSGEPQDTYPAAAAGTTEIRAPSS